MAMILGTFETGRSHYDWEMLPFANRASRHGDKRACYRPHRIASGGGDNNDESVRLLNIRTMPILIAIAGLFGNEFDDGM